MVTDTGARTCEEPCLRGCSLAAECMSAPPAAPAPSAPATRAFSRAEVCASAAAFVAGAPGGRALLTVGRLVLDVTPFLAQHPGGEATLRRFLGADAGAAFSALGHSAVATRQALSMAVGRLADGE